MIKFVYILFIILNLFSFSVSAHWQEVNYQETTIYNYIPQKRDGVKRALMVTLHGCRQSNENMRDYGNWEKTAEKWDMVVSVPEAPDGGVFVGCWDYFGEDQSMSRTSVNYLVTWIEKLLSDSKLNIDKNQVYISGFSSGAAMSMVIGCLRPDLISGVAVNSGPAIGTKYYQSKFIATTPERAANLCKRWAGDNAKFLKTQTSAIITGKHDLIVSVDYGPVIAEFYGILTGYNLIRKKLNLQKLSGNNKRGFGYQWSDGWTTRVTYILNKKLMHNWPAGVGRGVTGQASGRSIDFPEFLGEYFNKNNLRLKF